MGFFKKKTDIKAMRDSKDIEGLLDALEHQSQEIRMAAAFSLALIGDKRAEKQFIHIVKKDLNMESFLKSSKKTDLDEAKELVSVMFHAKVLIPQLGDKNPNVRIMALSYLIFEREKSVEPLIKYALKNPDWSVRALASVALGKIGSPAVDPLIKALGDPERTVRWGAALALGDIGDRLAVKPLTKALNDENEGVRMVVKEALEKIEIS
jgi:HEAT repeat protein